MSDILMPLPTCCIYVGELLLSPSYCLIREVTVCLTDYEKSNSCEVSVLCSPKYQSSEKQAVISDLTVGKKVTVKLGRGTPVSVFTGYIDSVQIDLSKEETALTFFCLDARGLLMGNRTWKNYENQSVNRIAMLLLNNVKAYADGIRVSVSGEADGELPVTRSDLDDYAFLCRLAERNGCSFRMDGGVLKFEDNTDETSSPSKTVVWGRDVLKFSRFTELSGQVGEVRVYGKNLADAATFSASAKAESLTGGKRKCAADHCAAVGGRVYETHPIFLKNQEEAQRYARSLLSKLNARFCTGEVTVLGDENVSPGSVISLEGFDRCIDGNYAVRAVRHEYRRGEFLTALSISSPVV